MYTETRNSYEVAVRKETVPVSRRCEPWHPAAVCPVAENSSVQSN